jgi:hypothetical protein
LKADYYREVGISSVMIADEMRVLSVLIERVNDFGHALTRTSFPE